MKGAKIFYYNIFSFQKNRFRDQKVNFVLGDLNFSMPWSLVMVHLNKFRRHLWKIEKIAQKVEKSKIRKKNSKHFKKSKNHKKSKSRIKIEKLKKNNEKNWNWKSRKKIEKIEKKPEKSHKNAGLRNAVLETSGWETDL